jgi:hypothetical protein
MINNMMAVGDGQIKTFALRGVKNNLPYMHDERLLTLEDTVEASMMISGAWRLHPFTFFRTERCKEAAK